MSTGALSTPEEVKDVKVDPAAARMYGAPGATGPTGGSSATATGGATETGSGGSAATGSHSSTGAGSSSQHSAGKGKGNTKDAEDKKKLLLTVAAGVAAITAIVLGVKKARENKDDDDFDSDQARAKAEGAVDTVREKLSQAKHQVVQVVPKPVKDAGNAASDKLGHAKDKVDNVGLEVERKGLKASEKSDHNVRKTYDNSHKPREDIKDAAKEAKHKGKEAINKVQGKTEEKKQEGQGCTIM